MKIGIDARPLSRRRAGIGNYVYGLIQFLLQMDPQHDYFLYSNREISVPVELADPLFHRQIEKAFCWCPGSLWILCRGSNMAQRDKLDILWMTSPVLPLQVPSQVFTIITVYDLVWLRLPETMKYYVLWVYRTLAERAIRKADMIVVISRSTGNDLVRFLGISSDKIVLVYPGISERYKPQDPLAAAKYISAKYDVPARYLAAVGTVEPRKNLRLLVEVLCILKKTGRLECPLLIAGAKGWKNSGLYKEVQEAGLTQDEIRFLGYLPDEDLPYFYGGAQLFLFPSHYEGFGLPPLEAMACGTPVIASNSPSMPEVLGDSAILESPTDAHGFASAVVRVLAEEDLRRKMHIAGIRRSAEFCWANSVQHLLQALEAKKKSILC